MELRYLNFAHRFRAWDLAHGRLPHADILVDERWVVYPKLGSTGTNL
jgi:hypothetical protein